MNNLELIHASSANQCVDAIVNAANKSLLAGSGICGAIFKKAGYEELTLACSKIKTPLNDGDAVITPAFGIANAKYIIHAVGPNFAITKNANDKLYLAYYNSLNLLKKYNLHSISFSLISSGIYGYGLDNPVENSTKECIKAYNDFTDTNQDYYIDVKLCAYSPEEYLEAQRLFESKER